MHPLKIEIERIAVIREDQSAHDVLTLSFKNESATPIALSAECLDLGAQYHDHPVELVTVRDWGGRDVLTCENRLASAREIRFRLSDPELLPGQTRTIAVHVRFPSLADRTPDGGLAVRDCLYRFRLPGVAPDAIRHRAALVFPRTPFRRRITAERAQVTSRTATWDWGSASADGDFLRLSAEQSRGALPVDPSTLDDAIAEIWSLLLESAVWGWQDTRELRRLLTTTLSVDDPLHARLADESALVDMTHEHRRTLYFGLLEFLRTQRDRITTEADSPPDIYPSTVALGESLARNAQRKMEEAGITAPAPARAGEALLKVLRYQQGQRERPRRWSPDVDEREFHEHVAELLGLPRFIGSEVPTAGGFADLVLHDTNLELKVMDLGNDPGAAIREYLPQAAEYPAARGDGLGLLVILDKRMYAARELGPPGVAEQTRVDVQPTLVGASGTSTKVCIITVVISANLPAPSKLRPGNRKPSRRSRSTRRPRAAR